MRCEDIDPRELKRRLDAGEPVLVLDVRQPWEFAHGHIPGSRLLPLDELDGRLDELDRRATIVTVCKVGERSAYAAEFLLASGFERVLNLRGGIHGWAAAVDPRVLP